MEATTDIPVTVQNLLAAAGAVTLLVTLALGLHSLFSKWTERTTRSSRSSDKLEQIAKWFPEDGPDSDGGLPGDVRRLQTTAAKAVEIAEAALEQGKTNSHDLLEHMKDEERRIHQSDLKFESSIRRVMNQHRHELAAVLEGRTPVDTLRQEIPVRVEDYPDITNQEERR